MNIIKYKEVNYPLIINDYIWINRYNLLEQILLNLGWDFVSLVVSDEHSESVTGAAAFHAVAGAARICVGRQFSMRISNSDNTQEDRKVDNYVTSVASRLNFFFLQLRQ